MILLKLGTMRKAKEFSVFEHKDKDGRRKVIVQSDKQTGEFDLETGEGVFSQDGPYFIHLSLAKPLTLDKDTLARVVEHMIKPGQMIGPGVVFAGSSEI